MLKTLSRRFHEKSIVGARPTGDENSLVQNNKAITTRSM